MLNILVEYEELREEIKDIRKRIQKLEKEIDGLSIVSDSVKGTKRDGTYGSIKITGYPQPLYYKKKLLIDSLSSKMQLKEVELLELLNQAEDYIESIEKSELRTMFRLYYLDNLTWVQVAHRMNQMFPKRRKSYTEDGCRMRNTRYFEKVL